MPWRPLNATPVYRELFGRVFPEVAQGANITFDMFGSAIAEFEFTLVFADASIDQFARGDKNALTLNQQRGALLFFGRARCVECHAVSGPANEMFSDFKPHVIGVPQIAPVIGNLTFDGPGENEDFRSRAMRRTVTNSALHRCATSPCNRRFFTTARSLGWKTRCAITWTCSPRRATTTPSAPVSPPTSRSCAGRLSQSLRELIRSSPHPFL